jgi:hypothetical protein
MTDEREGGRAAAREQAEWEKDQLVALVSRRLRLRAAQEGTAAGGSDEALLAWRARELRRRAEERGTQLAPERAAAVAERVRGRALAARLGVRRMGAPPDSRLAGVGGSVAEVVEQMAGGAWAPQLDLAVAAGSGRDLWEEPCESCLALPAGVPPGRYVALTVAGESMHPLLHGGDVVLVRVGRTLSPDTVVVARRPDEGYVVKRVGRVTRTAVELLSTNREFPPAFIPRRADLVVGAVVLSWCAHGRSQDG